MCEPPRHSEEPNCLSYCINKKEDNQVCFLYFLACQTGDCSGEFTAALWAKACTFMKAAFWDRPPYLQIDLIFLLLFTFY